MLDRISKTNAHKTPNTVADQIPCHEEGTQSDRVVGKGRIECVELAILKRQWVQDETESMELRYVGH